MSEYMTQEESQKQCYNNKNCFILLDLWRNILTKLRENMIFHVNILDWVRERDDFDSVITCSVDCDFQCILNDRQAEDKFIQLIISNVRRKIQEAGMGVMFYAYIVYSPSIDQGRLKVNLFIYYSSSKK